MKVPGLKCHSVAIVLIAAFSKPYPNPPPNPPSATPGPGRNPEVALIPPGEYQKWIGPVNKGQTIPANSIEGGLKPVGKLTVPPVPGARAGAYVTFMINIDPEGNVSPTRYLSDDNGLSPQVMAAAKAWRFNPPMVKGKAVSTSISVKVTF